MIERLRPRLELRGCGLELSFLLVKIFVGPGGLFDLGLLGLEASLLLLRSFLQLLALFIRGFLRILEEGHRFRLQIRSLFFS